jgi:hypothetical protein
MQRYAIIKNGIVENVIEYENAPSQPIPGFSSEYIAVADDTSSIGWTYANGVFTNPNPNPPTPPAPTPQPTLAELQAQLAALTAQINTLAGAK